jgi:hypothetical protein
MKDSHTAGFIAVLGAALAGAFGLGLWLIGGPTLRTVAVILAGSLGAALVILASSFPIRAYRRRDATGETHHYHEGVITRETRILDGRAQPVLLPGPGQQAPVAIFPELLRGAWQAGLLSGQPTKGQELDQGQDPGASDDAGWGGAIRP